MSKALFLVRGGLVLDLLYHWPKFFQRGGVLGAELLRRATQISLLDGVEHLACERQRSAAMILLADEVEFRPRRLMALEAIEPQEVVNFLRSLANNFRAVLVSVEGEELPIVRPWAESLLLLDHSLVWDQLQHGSLRELALSRLGDIDGARQIAGEIVDKEVLYGCHLGDALERGAVDLVFRFAGLHAAGAQQKRGKARNLACLGQNLRKVLLHPIPSQFGLISFTPL